MTSDVQITGSNREGEERGRGGGGERGEREGGAPTTRKVVHPVGQARGSALHNEHPRSRGFSSRGAESQLLIVLAKFTDSAVYVWLCF